MLCTCQSGYEAFLAQELELAGLPPGEKGAGWTRCGSDLGRDLSRASTLPQGTEPDFAFAHQALLAPVELRGESVNALAQQVLEFFAGSLRGERLEAPWPCVFACAAEEVGLSRRAGAVEKAFGELLRKKLARVAKLATPEPPRLGGARGLFVFFADFGRVFAAREAWLGGQRRMADDPAAPSRSYLKVEEAYGVLGREPQAGETVVDLGAAPGGWSYSAAKRGARVIAVDNGPLKGGALDHPLIEHRREDAFRFRPSFAKATEGRPAFALASDGRPAFAKASAGAAHGDVGCDWLFCDLVEEPHHVLRDIVAPWLAGGWCRRFVVNLKFGRVDPVALLREFRAPDSPLTQHTASCRIRHLYHDREEFTLVGEVCDKEQNGRESIIVQP